MMHSNSRGGSMQGGQNDNMGRDNMMASGSMDADGNQGDSAAQQ